MPPLPLMTREEETSCADRIAAGDAAVFEAIASSTHALEEVLVIGDRVASGDLHSSTITIADKKFEPEREDVWEPTIDTIRKSVAKNKPVSIALLSELRLNPFAIREVIAGLRFRVEERISNDLETGALRRSMAAINAGLDTVTKARNELVSRNLRLVFGIAKRYLTRGATLDDLVQDGNIGLMRAAELFSPSYQVKFGTYACYWIRQAVARGVDDTGSTIRVPVYTRDRYRKINLARRRLENAGGHASDEAVAADAGMSVEMLRETVTAHRGAVSLDAPIGEDGSADMYDVVASNAEPQGESVSRKRAKLKVEEVLRSLPARDQTVLRLRFGIDGGDGKEDMTLECIGKMHSLTRERIRQLEIKAIAKISEHSVKAKLREAAQDFGWMVGT